MITLNGLGALDTGTTDAISGFLTASPTPTSAQVGDFLKLYVEPVRSEVAEALIAAGVDPTKVGMARDFLKAGGLFSSPIYSLLVIASSAASGYHGIKRNNGSIGWGAIWALMGGLFPIFVPVVAVAQGYAKPRR